MTLKHILVATDFSADADAALAQALDLASSTAASVHVVHVVEDPLAAGMWASEIYAAEITGLQLNLVRDAEAHLELCVRSADRRRVPVTHGVRLGRAAPTIVDVAREIGADLIVMGARGRTRMSRVLIGGVAERVVRTAPCPVLTIHGRETTKHETPRARARQPVFKTILVPTDFNEPSERALDYAKALATRFGAALQILHVVREPFPSDSHAYVAEAAAIRERLFTEAERRLHTTLTTIGGLAATGRLREGPPAEQIAEAASDLGADLIVMGTHGRGPLAHLLMGSVAERVIRIAPCAVLTVRALATPGDGEPADRKAVVWK